MTADGWTNAKVGEIGSVEAGKAKDVTSSAPARPYLRVANVFDGQIDITDVLKMPFTDAEFERHRLREGDVLLNEGQSLELVGRCSIYRGEYQGPCAIQNALIRFRPGERTLSAYAEQLFRWCQHSGVFAQIATQTTSIAHLGVKRFAGLEVLLPPLPEQRKISAILSAVDEVIEKSEAVIKSLQTLKKAMMQELLTHGLPGRHTRFKQTEIGEIPEEWRFGPLGEFCELTSGGTPSRARADFWNGTIPWVKTGEINYAVIADTEEKITETGLAESSAKVLPNGTVVMAMYGQGATRGRVGILGIDAATNQACLGFLIRDGIRADYLYQLLSWSYERLRSMGHEGTQKNLSATLVRSLTVPVPSEDEQREIAASVAAIETRITGEAATRHSARDVKAALMSVLLTGEVRVTLDEDGA